MSGAAKKPNSPLTQTYLKVYNISMLIGWSYILFYYFVGALQSGFDANHMYPKMRIALQIFQYGAILEIFHAYFKIVPSATFTTAVQVYSRVTLVYVLEAVPESVGLGLLLLGFAWSVAEIVRYMFYAIKLFGLQVPYVLLWCRYSFFIVLYPMGVSGEVITLFKSLSYYNKSYLLGFIPSSIIIWLDILTYIPGLYMLYTYMLSQRKHVLGKPKNPNTPVEADAKKE
ncbi:very-long-chain (3R)-3-hydroxyacyl-CoA dehydratase [Entamoeba marina]